VRTGVGTVRGLLCSADLQVGIFRARLTCWPKGQRYWGPARIRAAGRAAGPECGPCAARPDPDVRKAFRSEGAVSEALRLVIELRKVGSYKRRNFSSCGA
jgi:hypothetical protein